MDKTYFIQGIDGGPIKIGRAQIVEVRLQGLQCGSPVVLRLLAATSTITERRAHARFSSSRLHGEWFAPTKELLGFIAKLQAETASESAAIAARESVRVAAEKRRQERREEHRKACIAAQEKCLGVPFWPRPVSNLELSMPPDSLAAQLLAKIRK